MRTIERDIVAAVIFSKDNKILLGMKDPNDLIYANTWGIPGGGVEKGETFETALQREIFEETGIDITECSVELIDNTNSGESEKRLKETGEVVYVKMKYFTYKVTLSQDAKEDKLDLKDDLVQSQWIEIDKLKTVPLNVPTQWLFTYMKLF